MSVPLSKALAAAKDDFLEGPTVAQSADALRQAVAPLLEKSKNKIIDFGKVRMSAKQDLGCSGDVFSRQGWLAMSKVVIKDEMVCSIKAKVMLSS